MADPNAFHDFLTNLSTDVSARNSFQVDPTRSMQSAGLSDSQIVAVLSQDAEKIQGELGGDVDAAFRVRVIVTILVEF